MSGTLLNHNPAESVFDDWKVDTYKALGEKLDAKTTGVPYQNTGPRRPLPPVQFNGRPAPDTWVGKKLAGQLFGDDHSRKGRRYDDVVNGVNVCRHDQNQSKIINMWMTGAAAPVKIAGEGGRNLSGNFYSATGYNLRDNGGKVDTSRPVVLLLTGSSGTAEGQGFDVSKFYAENGASVLSVNYAGFGGSDQPNGTPSELSMQQDAQSMLQHLIDLGYDPDKIIIHGYSMGAAVAAALQEANEADPPNGAGIKFRGAVQDRPMLSAVHGVESHHTKILHPVAALTRDEVGAFQGERAIDRLGSDTPMVITSDKGSFADRADELRARLKAPGNRSGSKHNDHVAMLNSNKDALLKLVAARRDGSADPIGAPTPSEMSYEKLTVLCQDALQDVFKRTLEAASHYAKLDGDVTEAKLLREDVLALMGDLIDVVNYLPDGCPEIAKLQPLITNAKAEQQKLAVELRRTIQKPFDPLPTTREEIDFVATRAAEVLDRLQQAGGPASAPDPLKNEVLEIANLAGAFNIGKDMRGRMRGDLRTLFDALKTARDAMFPHY